MGNAMYAVLAGAGFNLMKLLRALALFSPRVFALLNALQMETRKLEAQFDGRPAQLVVLFAA